MRIFNRYTAYYWAKIAYYNRPANQQLYNLLYDIANGLKDTIEMQKVFSVKTSTRPEASDYYGHSQSMYVINKNFNQRIATIEDGLKKFSKDSTLNFQKHFVQGLILGNELKYAESAVESEQALKYQNSPFANQNLGFAYFNTSKFNEAIPYLTTAINSNQFRDGRTEYIRGRCFFQLNQTDKACIDFKKATSMGYPVEMQMMMLCK